MSRTMIRNGRRVWECFAELSGRGGGRVPSYWSPLHISKRCGLSKPTVKKYLELAVEQGFAVRWIMPNGQYTYKIADGD